MENIKSVAEALDLSKEVIYADDMENTEVGEFISSAPLEDLVVARLPISSAQDATKKVKSYADVFISKDVSEKGSYKLGDTVFHTSKSYKYKVPTLPNFFKWLLEDITDEQVQTLCAIVGPNFVPKLRALDAIAAKRGRRTEVIRDTFLERNFAETDSLQIINCNTSAAPNWATSMEEGERYVRS